MITKKTRICIAVALATASALGNTQVLPDHQTSSPWFQQANDSIAFKEQTMSAPSATARNVILFVGDGMGISTLTAARILEAQRAGAEFGEENELYFENFPHTALVKTYNTNSQVPDSAGTMGAMVTGLKTDIGVFGYDETVERGDCSSIGDDNKLATYLEMAEVAGMSTGIVSTARVTHATPGALYAKTPDRNYEDVSDIPEDGSCAGQIEDIASQLINFESNMEASFENIDVDGIEVVLGGGRRHFIPNDAGFNVEKPADAGAEGDRTDGRDLPAEWLELYGSGAVYVTDQAGFDAIDTESTDKILGLFNESHMQYEADRSNDIAGEPSIAEMTRKAIEVLDNNPNGFFLMVESGRIDHAHHAGNAAGALTDTIAMAEAVKAAYDATDPDDTLILVTADHSHVMTMGGYVVRGNPILGKAVYSEGAGPELAHDSLPFTTLNYNNGRGFCDLGGETDSDAGYGCAITAGMRSDLSAVETETDGYHQEALVPLDSETHAGEDITIHATGPGSAFVRGTVEQSMVFHIMNNARPLIGE
ncbi:alkaline phosphatase [Haliea sp.]